MFELVLSAGLLFIIFVAYLGYKGVQEVIDQKNKEYQERLTKSFNNNKGRKDETRNT